MYRVMLIDDEERNLYVMKNLIDWEVFGFTVKATAHNGKEALAYCKKEMPDIIFVDIQMPVMDGLEFMEALCENEGSNALIIIVSAYDEFKYAQKAIQYGVFEYLLKPIPKKKMQEILIHAKTELDKKHTDVLFQEKLKFELSKYKMERSLRNALSYLNNGNTQEAQREINYIVQGMHGVPLVLSAVWSEREFDVEALSKEGKSRILWAKLKDGVLFVCAKEDNEILCSFYNRMLLGESCLSFYQPGLQFDTAEGFLSAYHTILKYKANCFYLDRSKKLPNKPMLFTNSKAPIDQYAIHVFVRTGIKDVMLQNIQKQMALFQEALEVPDNVISYCEKTFQRIAYEINILYGEIYLEPGFISISQKLNIYLLQRQIEKHLDAFMNKIQELLKLKTMNQVVVRAIHYTREHCFSPEFSVKSISESLHISKNYFLSLFKEEMNRNYWDFVTEIRMDEAKWLLLNTTKTVYEISNNIGYESQYYFSRKFKEMVGMPPLLYREKGVGKD